MENHAEKGSFFGTTTNPPTCNDCNATSGWNQAIFSFLFHEETGFESYPPALDGVRQFIHLACAGIGSPLNVMVANVIIRQRRLRNPRNTFWLGVIFCNLLALTNAIVEYVAFELMSAKACIIFRITAGIPYTLILVNLLLATLDRWVALTYPLFHRETVNVKLVVLVQLFFCTLVILLSTLPYWTEMIPLNWCGVDTTVLEWTTVVFLSLTLLSIMAQVHIYFKARSCLRKDLTGHISNHQQNRITRLEVEATVTLACGVVSLCFFSLPFSIVCMGDWICRDHQIAAIQPRPWCSFAQSALPYLRELLLVHSVYSPIMYMIRSREFSEAFRSTITCPESQKK